MLLMNFVVYEQILFCEKIRISDGYEALNWSAFTIYVVLSFLSVNRLVIHIEERLRVMLWARHYIANFKSIHLKLKTCLCQHIELKISKFSGKVKVLELVAERRVPASDAKFLLKNLFL